ncbi:hypothetical protein PISMIDRAFT_679216, partial [Pisolithus microcarpus 441]
MATANVNMVCTVAPRKALKHGEKKAHQLLFLGISWSVPPTRTSAPSWPQASPYIRAA